jgi:hypothetical protein
MEPVQLANPVSRNPPCREYISSRFSHTSFCGSRAHVPDLDRTVAITPTHTTIVELNHTPPHPASMPRQNLFSKRMVDVLYILLGKYMSITIDAYKWLCRYSRYGSPKTPPFLFFIGSCRE